MRAGWRDDLRTRVATGTSSGCQSSSTHGTSSTPNSTSASSAGHQVSSSETTLSTRASKRSRRLRSAGTPAGVCGPGMIQGPPRRRSRRSRVRRAPSGFIRPRLVVAILQASGGPTRPLVPTPASPARYRSHVSLRRRCSRTACPRSAVATLTYVYADQTAVLGPLATYAEPHAYDLCEEHSERLAAPVGWEVVRLAPDPDAGGPSSDDLETLANAVRKAARPAPVDKPRGHDIKVGRHGHLRALRSLD